MLHTRMPRIALSTLALAASVSFVVPASTTAAPRPAGPAVPPIAEYVSAEVPAALAPTILAAIAAPAPTGTAMLLTQARVLLATPGIPAQVRSTLERVITFLDGSGGGGPELPPSNGPRIAQFLYPTLGKSCIGAASDSVGTALAVPGPAELPPPGPKAGQTAFVLTALGTKAPAAVQAAPLTVRWVNLDNRRTGSHDLTTESAINPEGPATLSTVADTGSGRVAAVISGSLTTGVGAQVRTCTFAPTVGFFTVG
ncbi:hypothetical protein [Nocardia cyriacigeorgica]|uniref:Rv1157c family protein n=1 Tax=Nocardia cyriacigeorgica TaxID=135487 RepID=UPI002455D699|nr:hypothetical protein [Nocardia cyriacigeorgica]